jgi:hypothetical protein
MGLLCTGLILFIISHSTLQVNEQDGIAIFSHICENHGKEGSGLSKITLGFEPN